MLPEQYNIQDPPTADAVRRVVREINRETDELAFTVLSVGTEVTIPHGLNRAPTSAHQVITQVATGQGVVYPGSTAWDATNIYLTATATGAYAVRVRR